MCSTKMRVNLRTKKVRRHRIQETGLQYRRDEGKLKDHRDWRFQRESGDFKMSAMYQAGVDTGFVGPKAYTIWGSSLRK